MPLIENLETMLARGQDSAMLRFGLGSAYFNQQQFEQAIPHLERCLELDENYTAAYKLLGRALTELDKPERAREIFNVGLVKAGQTGDKQTEREIGVFLKKLSRRDTP
ncbi:MAG: tetratricopeptide repeat protein [Porticoccaceae bacterium]